MFLKVQSELPYEDFQIEDNLVIVQTCFARDVVGCSLVAKSCLTLCDPMDCSPLGSSVHGILQARILEWVAILFSTRHQ